MTNSPYKTVADALKDDMTLDDKSFDKDALDRCEQALRQIEGALK